MAPTVAEKASAHWSWIPSGERRECLGFKDGGGSVNSRPRERYRHINPVALKMYRYSRLPPRCIYRLHRSTGIQYCTGTKPAASINLRTRILFIYQIRILRGPRRLFCQMIHQKMIDFEDFTIQSIVPVISSPSGPVQNVPIPALRYRYVP